MHVFPTEARWQVNHALNDARQMDMPFDESASTITLVGLCGCQRDEPTRQTHPAYRRMMRMPICA